MSQFWQQRINNAQKYYNDWNTYCKCEVTERYYRNDQWKGRRDYVTVNYNPYTLNLFYSTIKIKLAGMLFQKPQFLISPKPGGNDWDEDLAMQSAGIKQDTLNTICQNPNSAFANNIKKAARDSFFRFGLIEVGYAADWRNPLKEDPLLADHGKDEKNNPRVLSDNLVPTNERFYTKRINPRRFRVSVSDADELNDHEWVGYFDYYYTKTLKKTKGIVWPKDYKTDVVSADYSNEGLPTGDLDRQRPEFMRLLNEGEISKVWHVWDLVEKKRLLLLDDNFETLWETDCDRLNLFDLRWDLDFEGWYPLPPAFYWLSPQDEINEAREQMRSFRRRFTRKYWYLKDAIEPEEVEKFTAGPDGVAIEFKAENALGEVPNAPINPMTEESLVVGKDDFNIVSGTSAEARGQSSDRETATSAKITDARSQIRESAEQLDFSDWVCGIARGILTTAKENLSEGLWVKWTTSPDQNAVMQDMKATNAAYKYITSQDLDDGYDMDIDVDVMNQTPAAMAAQQQSFIQFLSIVQQFPSIALSPVLVRKAALICGFRDERVIQQVQQSALLAAAAKTVNNQTGAYKQAGGNGGGGGSGGQNPDNVSNSTVSQMNSPTQDQIQSQLNNQLVQ